jgi:hypothetical protein
MSRKIYPNQTVFAIYQITPQGEKPCDFPGVLRESPFATKRRADFMLYLVEDLGDYPMHIKTIKWGEYLRNVKEA